jgi:hypothetical protein
VALYFYKKAQKWQTFVSGLQLSIHPYRNS